MHQNRGLWRLVVSLWRQLLRCEGCLVRPVHIGRTLDERGRAYLRVSGSLLLIEIVCFLQLLDGHPLDWLLVGVVDCAVLRDFVGFALKPGLEVPTV